MITSNINKELIDNVTLDGGSLNIFLKPDHENKLRGGANEYIENYFLPNIVIQDDKLAAFSDGNHLDSPSYFFEGVRSYYSYTNACDAFINFSTVFEKGQFPKCNLHMMSLSRYSELEWITRSRYIKIYDGENCMDEKDTINKHIRDGSSFRVSLEIDTNSWICVDVDLPFFIFNENQFQFQTKIHWYPIIFDNLVQTDKELAEKGFPKFHDPNSQAFAIDLDQSASCTYLSIYSDGSYDDHSSLKIGKRKSYKRMVLFAG